MANGILKIDSALQAALEQYNETRTPEAAQRFCNSPWTNMYIQRTGLIGPCWKTGRAADASETNLKQVWQGAHFLSIRDSIASLNLKKHCADCEHAVLAGNYLSPLARVFDNHTGDGKWPACIEFELSNTCNLECVMCTGMLSSTIRSKREKLPPLHNHFDDRLIDDLREFIPHLKEAKFLGGEPFLIEIYFKIWDLIAELNPNIAISVTTNGNALSKRAQSVLNKLKFNLIVSLDAVDKDLYESIRVRGHFKDVMKNFEFFRTYTAERGSDLQISANPMPANWFHLKEIVRFATRQNARLWFNTVLYPYKHSLSKLHFKKLEIIHRTLTVDLQELSNEIASEPSFQNSVGRGNVAMFRNFVENQLAVWLEAARKNEAERQTAWRLLEPASCLTQLQQSLTHHIQSDHYLTDTDRIRLSGQVAAIFERLQSFSKQEMIAPQDLKTFWQAEPQEILSHLDQFKAIVERAPLARFSFKRLNNGDTTIEVQS